MPTGRYVRTMMADWTYADIWENVAQIRPEAPALVHGTTRRPWREFDRRADGIARLLLDAGCRHQDKVALYLFNGPEYLETFYACSKASLVHVNTNHRYTPEELAHIWADSDAVAVVFHGTFTSTIEQVRHRVPKVRIWLWVDDGAGPCPPWARPYEGAASTVTTGPVTGTWRRSGDDLVLLYTGGTTGMPKGVMWRQGDLFAVIDRSNKVSLPLVPDLGLDGVSRSVRQRLDDPGPVSLPACPLMHGTGLLNAANALSLGGSVVTLPSRHFDATVLLDTIEAERAKSVVIVGDAFAKPILRALEAEPRRWDLTRLRLMISSGVMWSADTKRALSRHLPQLIMIDGFGSSEAIGMGESVSRKDRAATTGTFTLGPEAVVVGDDGQLVEPGSGQVGRIGVRGHTPVGYYKDPEKTASTFPIVNGVRYSLPGDFATVETDGTITLLGRGSLCINTGGEKVFPEEVEEVVKTHPAVRDAIVLGLPDDRFGQVVAAVVVPHTGQSIESDDLIAHVRAKLARYKAPREVFLAQDLERADNGKVDYTRWTQRVVTAAPTAAAGTPIFLETASSADGPDR
jgi:fatty-acyl-CoA synthase